MSIDVHTHGYFPRYMKMLRERKDIPRVVTKGDEDRLLIIPGEDVEQEDGSVAGGRVIGPEYHNLDEKLKWMDAHNIQSSVISLANPWLDFMAADEAASFATLLNGDLQTSCVESQGRIFGFGTLPLVENNVNACLGEMDRIHSNSHLVGFILGTRGMGNGLDDPALEPIWEKAAALGLTVFLHPHYGVGMEHFGNAGHALVLGLGFTFETTTMVSRMVLSGIFERHPNLKVLLAHSGGTLPFLAGRLDSCVKNDPHTANRLPKAPSEYLRNLYYDACCYHKAALDCTISFADPDRVMFGTDHPFSIADPQAVYDSMSHLSEETRNGLLRDNAVKILGLPGMQ